MRRILAGMAMDQIVCARISSQWTPSGLFDSQWVNLAGNLIVNHFRQYGKNPNGQMTGIFEQWAIETTADETTVQAIESFLHFVSTEYEPEPSEFVLDVAGRYFNKVRMEREIEAAKMELDNWQVDSAQDRFSKMNRVNLGVGSYVTPGKDVDAWELVLNEERTRPLVVYRGALGDFTKGSFGRGTFWSFLAPDKVGKTSWQIDLTYSAIRRRAKVAYFDLGDGTIGEVMERLTCRVMGNPTKEGALYLPTGWNEKELIHKYLQTPILYEVKFEDVNPIQAFNKFRKLCKNEEALRVSCHPNDSLSVFEMDEILEQWDREGWRPDVVVLDYADILAPPKGIVNMIEQIDKTWKTLKQISQKRHCCVVTATQSSRKGYEKDSGEVPRLLGRNDFADSKKKLAHVDGMLGLNVTSREKEYGMSRVNWIIRRKGYYNEKAFVQCAGHLGIQSPSIISRKHIYT